MTKSQIKKIYRSKKKEIRQSSKDQLAKVRREYLDLLDGVEGDKIKSIPKRSVLEEIGNSVTHGVGALFAVATLVFMLLASSTPYHYAGAIIYSVGLFVMFAVSCLYHAFGRRLAAKRLFRRFDYCCIYLLIGATYAPILLNFIGGIFGWMFFIIQWFIIILGTTLVAVFGQEKLKALHIIMYFVIGWSGLLFIPRMFESNIGLFAFILGGGVVYSLGLIPFLMKKAASHFIWHFFVLAGAVVQWFGIYLFIYLKC